MVADALTESLPSPAFIAHRKVMSGQVPFQFKFLKFLGGCRIFLVAVALILRVGVSHTKPGIGSMREPYHKLRLYPEGEERLPNYHVYMLQLML